MQQSLNKILNKTLRHKLKQYNNRKISNRHHNLSKLFRKNLKNKILHNKILNKSHNKMPITVKLYNKLKH